MLCFGPSAIAGGSMKSRYRIWMMTMSQLWPCARATSSLPGAFSPVQLGDIDRCSKSADGVAVTVQIHRAEFQGTIRLALTQSRRHL